MKRTEIGAGQHMFVMFYNRSRVSVWDLEKEKQTPGKPIEFICMF